MTIYFYFRYDEDSVKKRQTSIEIAAVLLDAHNEDQKESLKKMLSISPANYNAENIEEAMKLYKRTYMKQEESSTNASESFDTDDETQDKTFSLDKPTIEKTSTIPSVETTVHTRRKQQVARTSSITSSKSSLRVEKENIKKDIKQIDQKEDQKERSKKETSSKKQSNGVDKKISPKTKTKTPVTSSGALGDRKTFKVSYEIVTDEEDSGDEYQRDNAVDLHDCLNLVPVTPQPFPDPPVSSPVHHPGSGVSYGPDDPRNGRRVNNLDLLRDHCSGRLTPCCNGGQHTIHPEFTHIEDLTSLHIMSEKESIACVDKILALQPELLNKKDDEGYTPLHLAVIAGNRPVIKYLISRGADINAVDNERHSALHWAIVCGELDALDMLHDAGADPSIPDNHGALPIHYAVQMCSPGSNTKDKEFICQMGLKKLLSWKVDITVKDKEGRDPLLWAASAGSLYAIKALISNGADISSEDKDGLTSLHCAASRGHSNCLMTLIKDFKADPNVIDCNGCTALFYAVTLGHISASEILLRAGAQPNKQDRKGRTASHCGAAKGMLDSLRLLQKFKTDLWIPNVRGDMPLHESIQSGKKDVVGWFLSLKPSHINVPNNDGRCIIHIAALNNDIEMCKMLIDHAAFVNPIMRNARGQLLTPLDAALHRGNKGCAKYLQLHGGVAASKLTDRNALQKALSRAINESQLQLESLMGSEFQYNIEAEGNKMVRFSNDISSIGQTETIENLPKTSQSAKQMIDASNQSCIETLTTESQTSPKLLSSVEVETTTSKAESSSTELPTNGNCEKEVDQKDIEKSQSEKMELIKEQNEMEVELDTKMEVMKEQTEKEIELVTKTEIQMSKEVMKQQNKKEIELDTKTELEMSKKIMKEKNEMEIELDNKTEIEISKEIKETIDKESGQGKIDKVKSIKLTELGDVEEGIVEVCEEKSLSDKNANSDLEMKTVTKEEANQCQKKDNVNLDIEHSKKEDDDDDVIAVYESVDKSESSIEEKELGSIMDKTESSDDIKSVSNNQAIKQIRIDVKDIKKEIKDIKQDFEGIKNKEFVEIKESINKIQSKVSQDIGNVRSDLKSFKDELYYQGRPDSKVNTPMLSEGIIEGRAPGRDNRYALDRENSVMSGFREDVTQSVASVHETVSDSGSEMDFPLKSVKDSEHIVIEDQDAEERIKKARDARKEYFEQEELDSVKTLEKDNDSSLSMSTVMERKPAKKIEDKDVQASMKKPRDARKEQQQFERDTDSNTSMSTVMEIKPVKKSKERKNSSGSEGTDTETEKSRKSLDDSVKDKYKKDWEIDELKTEKPKKKAPLLSEASKQSAFDNADLKERQLLQQSSIESLKIEAEKIRHSFTKTMEDDAKSLESEISERLSGQVDSMSKSAAKKIEESTDNMIKITTKKLEDKTSDVTAVSYRQIEQQSDKIAQETVQFVQYDLDNKTKILKEALFEAEKTKKALEFQLKMKALEVEAVLDTAEETRKKIEELTKEKEKETEEQYVNRLLHKHNVRQTENEEKESDERIKKARRDRMEFFQKESELSVKTSYSDATSEFESDTETESKSVITKESPRKTIENTNNEDRETQYSPTDSFISLHDKYEKGPQNPVKRVYVQSQEIQTSIEELSEKTESSTWFPGVISPVKANKPTKQTSSTVVTADKLFSRPTSAKTVMKSVKTLNEPQSVELINSDSEDSDLDFDSVKRQEKYSNRKSSAKIRERDSYLRDKQRQLEDRILLSSPDRAFPMLDEQLMGQKNVAFNDDTKDSDIESSLITGTNRSLDPKDSGFSDAKSSVHVTPKANRYSPFRDENLQKLDETPRTTPRTPRVQLPPPRREEFLDSDDPPESLDPSRSSSILRRIPPRKEKIGINWHKNTIQQVTEGAPTNVKRYQLERRIFQELLELKRLQIRASKANESVIVKQLSERYNNTVKNLAPGEQYRGNFLFKEFEAFLYTTLQKIQSPEKASISSNYSLPLTDSGSSTPLYQYQSTQSRYVPRSRKFTELERLSNILKRHNVDCSNMTKGNFMKLSIKRIMDICFYIREKDSDSL